MAKGTIGERLYRQLLRMYPRDFTDDYGDEMTGLYRDRVRGEGAASVWVALVGDLMRTAPREQAATLVQDVRHAWRTWGRTPILALTAILTLAVGVGANTAVFSVVHGVLLRPLPYPDAERLVELFEHDRRADGRFFRVSLLNYLSWVERARSFDALATFSGRDFIVTEHGDPERIVGSAVTASLFTVLGVAPIVGRPLSEGDEQPGAPPVAVLADSLWIRGFGRDPAVVSRSITLNGTRHQIIGIVPTTFREVGRTQIGAASAAQIFVPLTMNTAQSRSNHTLRVVGRLRTQVSLEQARDEMQRLAAGMLDGRQNLITGVLPANFHPQLVSPPAFVATGSGDIEVYRANVIRPSAGPGIQILNVIGRLKPGVTIGRTRVQLESIREQQRSTSQRPGGSSQLRVVPYADKLVGDARKPLIVLQAAVALVLLIVCVNTANLLLVRGWARQREIAIRTAIGAGRARVLRQFFVESLLLGAVGCAAGLVVARGIAALMVRLLPLAVPRLSETTIDARVLLFALGACVAMTLVFALVPAIAVWKTNVYETLKGGARSASSSARSVHVRSALVAIQVALTVVLLVAAGLMVRSFWNMRNGLGTSGRFARSSITANTCPMNCTRILVVISASITRPSGRRLHTIEMTPSTTRDTCGNRAVGCSRPNMLKKYPSRAAAYGMRE